MRISVYEDDPGYAPWKELIGTGKRIMVKLNGVDIKGVQTADTNEGFVLVDRLNEHGEPTHDGTNWLVDRKEGRVEIELVE